MHLQMQRGVWLDVINLTSKYMQLASGFMQLAAAERRRNKVHFLCLFEGNMLIVH